MANKIPRVPVREQDPAVRAHNFEEVCYGYNEEEALLEASRCLHCKNPRCMAACPVSIKIPDFIERIVAHDFAGAAGIIAQDSSLPAVCGRVCPQETQCEGSCVLGVKGQPVAIGKLERFVADWSRESGKVFLDKAPSNGMKVAVIGSGPSGLACASDLAKAGYEVTVFEALHKAGGVLQYGIPEFRLPKQKVVEHEVDNLRKLGVKIETDVVVGRTVTVDELFDKEGFKAVFIGSGAGLPRFMGIPGENLNGVFSANEFLTRNNLMHGYDPEYDTPVFSGKHVVVVGGGNVAMDAARTALRLGSQVTIVYRRTENELPARREEVHHAKEEGIEFRMLTNPVEILGDEKGWVRGIRCIRMELGDPDESGRRSPVEVKGSEFDIEADTVIMSLGTSPNPTLPRSTHGIEINRKGCIVADESGVTTRPMVFAGGDAVTGASNFARINVLNLMNDKLKIVVLAKQVPDTRNVGKDAMKEDGTVNRSALPAIFNPEDMNALEQALRIKDRLKDVEIHLLTMGPGRAADIVREGLFRGADGGVLLTDRKFAGADTLATSYALSQAVRKIAPDMIIAGRQAIDGDTAQVGPQVAEKLDWPQITYAEEILYIDNSRVTVRRRLERGIEVVSSPLPVLITVTGTAAPCRPRNAKQLLRYKGARTVSEEQAAGSEYAASGKCSEHFQIPEWGFAEIGGDEKSYGMAGSPTKVKKIENIILQAKESRTLSDSDADIEGLVKELISSHTIG